MIPGLTGERVLRSNRDRFEGIESELFQRAATDLAARYVRLVVTAPEHQHGHVELFA
jgi:hypothetical protein